MVLALVLVGLVAACFGAALAAASLGTLTWLRALGRWRKHAHRGAKPQRKAGDTASGPVLVEGVLRGAEEAGSVLLATAVPPADAAGVPGENAVNAAAPQLWIEMPDGAILIAAEAVVVSGSREIVPGQASAAVKRALGDLPAELCAIAVWQVRCLRAGDRVRAAGRIESAPDLDGPAGYRSRAVRHRLFAAEPARTITVAGVRPPRLFIAPHRRWTAAAMGAAAGLALAFLGLVSALPNGPPVATARQAPDQIDRLLEAYRFEEAATGAEAAGDFRRAARGYFFSGDLVRAASAFSRARGAAPAMPPSWNEMDSYIAAHFWDQAADIADKLAEISPEVASDVRCLAAALHRMRITDPTPPPPVSTSPARMKFALCRLVHAEVEHTAESRTELHNILSALDFGFPRPGRPPPPMAFEMDARVAAVLLLEAGDLKSWPLSLPLAASVVRADGPVFRMPLFALHASASRRTPEFARQERMERAAMEAAWLSFMGDHDLAATAFREALLQADLEAAAPSAETPRKRPFNAPRIGTLLGRKAPEEPDWSKELFSLGAALAMRAGEAREAAAYSELVPEADDRTGVGIYVRALSQSNRPPPLQLVDLELPAREGFLTAAYRDESKPLYAALEASDAQGLWPIFGPRLALSRSVALAWASGGPPAQRSDCGLYGLVAYWAGRRAAAQALAATEQEQVLGARLARLREVLSDRQASVFLYMSGRLLEPESD
jgi:hypothetical protein